MITKTEWVFLAWNTFHRFESDALRAAGMEDLTESDRALLEDICGLLDRLGEPYSLTVSDVINGMILESADPPAGEERLADYIVRRKLYELSPEELLKVSPEDLDKWPHGELRPISEQAKLRANCCRLAGAIAMKVADSMS